MSQTKELFTESTAHGCNRSALCVDLDGTLVKSDTLIDALFALFRREPVSPLRCSLFLMQGKAAFKAEVARHVSLNPATLPYNRPLLDYLRGEHAAGRDIYLTTASNEEQAKRIADHLGIFAGVFASNEKVNLRHNSKRAALEEHFHRQGFDYVGNSLQDVPVLERANVAMLANPAVGMDLRLKRKKVAVQRVFQDRAPRITTIIDAARIKQWPKNLLIFLPLLLAHLVFHQHRLTLTFLAFISWSLTASATYILNDLLDMEADRSHPAKHKRPFAAGNLSPQTGLVMVCVLVAVAAMIAAKLPIAFTFWLASYFVTTVAYSLVLKKIALIDVITLAGLYTVRIVAGASVTNVALSPWLGGFSIFFFLSLAIVKRYAELDNLRRQKRIPQNGRGYRLEDLEQLRSFGTASAYASVVVFTLYINNNPDIVQLYPHFQRLWLLAPLMIFWINRIWLLAHRGELQEDPVVFALTDYWSAILGVVALLVVWIAI